jgi:hypothetical protein
MDHAGGLMDTAVPSKSASGLVLNSARDVVPDLVSRDAAPRLRVLAASHLAAAKAPVGFKHRVMELGTSIYALSLALAKTVPRKRGRGSHLAGE